jgi:hypothetical protein
VIPGQGRASGRRAGTASAIVHRPPGDRGDPPADREGSGRRPCARKPPRDGRDLTGARGDGRPADCASEAKRRLVAEKPLFGAKMFPVMGDNPSCYATEVSLLILPSPGGAPAPFPQTGPALFVKKRPNGSLNPHRCQRLTVFFFSRNEFRARVHLWEGSKSRVCPIAKNVRDGHFVAIAWRFNLTIT